MDLRQLNHLIVAQAVPVRACDNDVVESLRHQPRQIRSREQLRCRAKLVVCIHHYSSPRSPLDTATLLSGIPIDTVQAQAVSRSSTGF